MNLIFISIIIIVILIIIIIRICPTMIRHSHFNYLNQFSSGNHDFQQQSQKLYDLCQKYSYLENITIEPSIKINRQGINCQRITMPIFIDNFRQNHFKQFQFDSFCHDLSQLICKNNHNLIAPLLTQYLNNQFQKGIGSDDIIVGYDWLENTFKLYTDQKYRGLQCLEFNLKTEHLKTKDYQKCLNNKYNHILDELNSSSIDILKNLKVGNRDHIESIYQTNQTYHLILKPSSKLKLELNHIIEIQNFFEIDDLLPWFQNVEHSDYLISTISFTIENSNLSNLCLYLKPNHLWSRIDYLQSMLSRFKQQ